jgi:hypothetical protein
MPDYDYQLADERYADCVVAEWLPAAPHYLEPDDTRSELVVIEFVYARVKCTRMLSGGMRLMGIHKWAKLRREPKASSIAVTSRESSATVRTNGGQFPSSRQVAFGRLLAYVLFLSAVVAYITFLVKLWPH